MIKEYCDRCNEPVGKMHDGGYAVPKYQLQEILALLGRKRDYVVCGGCKDYLVYYLDHFFSGDNNGHPLHRTL